MRAWRARLSGAALAVLLAACAFVNPTQIAPGTPRAEVLQALGQPTARYPLPDGGERLQYSRSRPGKRCSTSTSTPRAACGAPSRC